MAHQESVWPVPVLASRGAERAGPGAGLDVGDSQLAILGSPGWLVGIDPEAELTIGEPGVLKDCEIVGRGKITVHGRFFERKSPGIVGGPCGSSGIRPVWR